MLSTPKYSLLLAAERDGAAGPFGPLGPKAPTRTTKTQPTTARAAAPKSTPRAGSDEKEAKKELRQARARTIRTQRIKETKAGNRHCRGGAQTPPTPPRGTTPSEPVTARATEESNGKKAPNAEEQHALHGFRSGQRSRRYTLSYKQQPIDVVLYSVRLEKQRFDPARPVHGVVVLHIIERKPATGSTLQSVPFPQ